MRARDADKLIEGLKVVDKTFGLKGLLPMMIQAINHQPTVGEVYGETFLECDGTICCKTCGVGGIDEVDIYCYNCGVKFNK